MRIVIPILVIAMIFSCSDNNTSLEVERQEGQTNSVMLSKLSNPTSTDAFVNSNTKLIRTANYYFKVNSIKKSTEAIEQTLLKYPAFISSSNLDFDNNQMQSEFTIRVQNEYFEEVLKEIDKEAIYIHYRNVAATDASKEFVDLESRLKSKREVEKRYMEILRGKAGTIEELLEAEKKIGILHEEIEATISRINFLNDQVTYSTINLKFYQEIDELYSNTENNLLGTRFKTAFLSGLNGLIEISLLLTNAWPLLLMSTGIFFIWRSARKGNIKPWKA